MTTNNPVTDRAREITKEIMAKSAYRIWPADAERNITEGIRDILAGQSAGDYVLVPREQIEKLANKQDGYGMAYHAKGIGSNGSAEIHLYGKRAEAAHWLMQNGLSLAATPAPSRDEVERVRNEIINTPETADFMAGVPIEAAHQRERWAVDHDAGKSPFDWFWLIGYLAQKAASSAVAGDSEKAKHHTISTAAALANWHAALVGIDTRMRPGTALSNKDSGDVQ